MAAVAIPRPSSLATKGAARTMLYALSTMVSKLDLNAGRFVADVQTVDTTFSCSKIVYNIHILTLTQNREALFNFQHKFERSTFFTFWNRHRQWLNILGLPVIYCMNDMNR